ncbi:hypothetical protein Acsp05_19700 [Actinokineospora sp. NBRC 105648]|nr:hypothetical protein Acsp05_19700 [Actinokineospora sp. NBRC 105648]
MSAQHFHDASYPDAAVRQLAGYHICLVGEGLLRHLSGRLHYQARGDKTAKNRHYARYR